MVVLHASAHNGAAEDERHQGDGDGLLSSRRRPTVAGEVEME
jgi:hypothetical protein